VNVLAKEAPSPIWEHGLRNLIGDGPHVSRAALGIFLSFLQSHHKQCLYLQSYRFICFSPKDLKVNN